MNALALVDRTRLAKLAGMFGSDHAGERAAAALHADKLVRGAGMTWSDVLAPETAPHRADDRTAVDIMTNFADRLTAWELDFLANVRRRTGPMSAKQREVVDQIRARLARAPR